MRIHVTWMDGMEADFKAESARVWEGVLVLLNVTRMPATPAEPAIKRLNLPVSGIREWSDEI